MQFGQLKRREFIFELAMTSRRISGGVGVRYESSAVAAPLTAGLLRLKE